MTTVITSTDYIQVQVAKFQHKTKLRIKCLQTRKDHLKQELSNLVKKNTRYNNEFYNKLAWYKRTIKQLNQDIQFWQKLL